MDGISGISSYDRPLLVRRLKSPDGGRGRPLLRLVRTPLSPHEGVGIASSAHREGPDSRDGCYLGCTAEKTMVLSVPNTEGGATHMNKRGRPQALSYFGPLQPSTLLKRSLN